MRRRKPESPQRIQSYKDYADLLHRYYDCKSEEELESLREETKSLIDTAPDVVHADTLKLVLRMSYWIKPIYPNDENLDWEMFSLNFVCYKKYWEA